MSCTSYLHFNVYFSTTRRPEDAGDPKQGAASSMPRGASPLQSRVVAIHAVPVLAYARATFLPGERFVFLKTKGTREQQFKCATRTPAVDQLLSCGHDPVCTTLHPQIHLPHNTGERAPSAVHQSMHPSREVQHRACVMHRGECNTRKSGCSS